MRDVDSILARFSERNVNSPVREVKVKAKRESDSLYADSHAGFLAHISSKADSGRAKIGFLAAI